MIARAGVVMLLLVACSSSARQPAATSPRADTKAAAEKPVTDAELIDARVAGVEVRGLSRIGESRARLAIAIKTGDPFDRTKIRESLRRLMTIRGVADARAVAFRKGGGKIGIAFVIVESPPVESVTVSGNQALGANELLSTAAVPVGAPLDPVAAQKAALAIKERYQGIGHYRAEVDWTSTAGKVHFKVREGPRASIARIAFPGARALSPEKLKTILLKASPENTAGGVYQRSSIDLALPHITAAYYDIGHVNVSVGPPVIATPTPETIEVSIPVREGEQFRLGKLSVTGELSGPEKGYLRQLKLRRGEVFSRSEITGAIERLGAYHKSRTKAEAAPQVTPLTEVDPARRRIDIRFEIR